MYMCGLREVPCRLGLKDYEHCKKKEEASSSLKIQIGVMSDYCTWNKNGGFLSDILCATTLPTK